MATRPKGRIVFETKRLLEGGLIVEIKVTEVAVPVTGSDHLLKYRLFCGRPGERLILYDNERGKGDHRHYGLIEEPYEYSSFDRLMEDFLADVRALRAKMEDIR